MNFKNR